MKHENLNIKEIMEARLHAVDESLHTISAAELQTLADELFPGADHPWLERFHTITGDSASGTFHHAMADDHTHVLYCHDKNVGMWFIRGSGKGLLQMKELKIMKEVVEARA